jgi:predicted phosphodiesterase
MSKTLQGWKEKADPKTVIKNLRDELKSTQAEADISEQIREWVGTAKLGLTDLETPKWLITPKTAKSPGVPNLTLSDLHWGEYVDPKQVDGVNSFSLAIARRRLRTVVESTVALARVLDPEMRYPGIVCDLGGDMISGDIHEELAQTNELDTMPTVFDLYRQLVPAIQTLADSFGAVFLPCVTGNHDRNTKKTHAKNRHHTSFSWLLYQFLAERFAGDKRVTFFIPDGSDARYRVYDLRYLLTHGDQFKAGDSIIGPIGPILRGEQKKLAARQAVGQDYDVMVFGHWHRRLLDSRLRGNASLKGHDEWTMQNNFRPEPPSQNFWITHPDHGIIWDTPVYCEARVKTVKTAWVSIPKKVAT